MGANTYVREKRKEIKERVTNTTLERKGRKRELGCHISVGRKERTGAEGNGETVGLFTFHQVTVLWSPRSGELYYFE